MALRFETEELDDETLHYLRQAREMEGEGMPGIYLNAKEAGITTWLPGCGAGVGASLIFVMLIISCASLNDPINLAMLQTAGFGLGIWLMLAWVRSLIARARSDYVGYFKFVDPLYIWHGEGRGLWVTPIEGVRSASVDHNHSNEGNYTNSSVRLRVGDEKIILTIKSMGRAEQVTAFLEAVAEMSELAAIDRGYRAKGITDLDEDEMRDRVEALIAGEVLPSSQREGRRRPDEHREVEAIPEPHQVRSAFGWWRYLVVIFAALVMFFTFKAISSFTRDGAMYDEVKGKSAWELREYLIDKRNTRYRVEVQKLLNAKHEQAATRIRTANGGSRDLKNGLADIVDSLKKTILKPVVTIGFKGKHEAARGQEGAFTADKMRTRQKAASKALAEALIPVVGDDLAHYADAAEGTSPNIEIGYDIKPYNQFGQTGYETTWTVTLRADPPDGKPHVFRTTLQKQTGLNPDDALQRLHNELVQEIKRNLPVTNSFMPGPGMPGGPPIR